MNARNSKTLEIEAAPFKGVTEQPEEKARSG
jgi:hypothetical protein